LLGARKPLPRPSGAVRTSCRSSSRRYERPKTWSPGRHCPPKTHCKPRTLRPSRKISKPNAARSKRWSRPRIADRKRATAGHVLGSGLSDRGSSGGSLSKDPPQAGQGALAARPSKPCLVCGRTPCDAHHVRFAEPRALGRKAVRSSPFHSVALITGKCTSEATRGPSRNRNGARQGGEPEARRGDSAKRKRTAHQRSCDSLTRLSSEQMLSCAAGTPMSAFIIRYIERTQAGSDGARVLLAHRIEGLWDTPLQFEDTWLIQSNETSDHIRDQLTELVPDGDALIVIAAAQDAAWAGLGPVESEWLIAHI
jgi:hypothetical protein